MLLNALHLENYKQYRHLDLEFREGLVGIIGKNGAGKSTLFEAILYCLFGKDVSNKELIRSVSAPPKATVALQLDFSLGETLYRVRREFRGKALATNAELFKNDVLVAKGVLPVNEEIVKVLHLERDAFRRSVFSGQKELSQLSDTTGEARKKMVRKMLGLTTLDDIQVAVNADRKSLENQILGQRQNLLTEANIQGLEAAIATHLTALADLETPLREASLRLETMYAEYQLQKQRFDLEATRLQRHNDQQAHLGRLHTQQEGLLANRQALEHKRQALELQQQQLEAERPAFRQYESELAELRLSELASQQQQQQRQLRSQVDALAELLRLSQQRLAELEDARHQLDELERELEQKQLLLQNMNWGIEEKERTWQGFTNRVSTLSGRIQEREEKIKALKMQGPTGECPTCGRPLLDAYEDTLLDLHAEIRDLQLYELHSLEQERIAAKAALNALRDHHNREEEEVLQLLADQIRLQEQEKQYGREQDILRQLENQVARATADLHGLAVAQFDAARHRQLQATLPPREPVYRRFKYQEEYVGRELPATLHELASTDESQQETARLIVAGETALAETAFNQSAYDLARQEFASFDAVLVAQTNTVRGLERAKQELENALRFDRDKINTNARIQLQISDKMSESDLLRKIGEHLNEFKTEILEKVSPSISQEASALFSRITKGKYENILVDENFDFSIADGGAYYPIERFSGGEIDLANFCLRIAITKAIMELSGSGQRIEFLAFDEVFGSQDEERRHEMMLALHYLQEQFRQIYIVSHIESLRDYFPNILEVKFGVAGSGVDWV